METRLNPVSDFAAPPGRYLAEVIAEKGISQAKLAIRLGRPSQAVNEIIKGKKEITSGTALALESVLGVSARFWLGLEANFRIVKERLKEDGAISAEIKLARRYPVRDMVRLGWIAPARGMAPIVTELRCFFGVASLTRVELAEPAAFRRTRRRTASPYALAAWLRRGKISAAAVGTASFSKKNLMALIPRMRRMTGSTTPDFLSDLKRDLAATGVALAVVPCIRGTYASGAMHRIGPEKAVIQLSNRGKYGDMFWFSLFHEIGHVVLHKDGGVFIADQMDGDAKESAADRFARDRLLPPSVFGKFKAVGDFTARSVQRFAKETGVHPGVVVGRIQHEGLVRRFSLNELRIKYELAQ